MLNITLKKTFLLLLLLIITVYYLYNSGIYELYSENLVTSMIPLAYQESPLIDEHFGLSKLEYDGTLYNGKYSEPIKPNNSYLIYNSRNLDKTKLKQVDIRKQQIGIQGFIVYWLTNKLKFNNKLPPNYCYKTLRLISSILLAIIIILIALEIKKHYNILFSICFYLTMILSQETRDMAPNLYWLMFSWLLPMYLSLLCINNPSKRFFIYPLILLSISFKSACGYEFMSNIMLCTIIFPLIEAIYSFKTNPLQLKHNIRLIIGISLSCLLGFTLVFLVNCYYRGNGEITIGLNKIYKDDIQRRTFGNPEDFDPVFSDSLKASVFNVLFKYCFFTQSGLFATLLILLYTISNVTKKRMKLANISKKEILIITISWLSSISWFVLAKSHSFIHIHINPILWYLPFIPIACFFILKNILEISNKTNFLSKYEDLLPK